MEDLRDIRESSGDDGVDQGAHQGCGEALCASEVSGPDNGDRNWTSRPGSELNEETYYRIKGRSLNTLYRTAVTNFNRIPHRYDKDSPDFTYSEAFWNGYGCAIACVRDAARDFAIDSEVQ